MGTWNVAAELVVQPSEDPYAPQPGTIQQDTWVIEESASGLILTSAKGSCGGQYTKAGGAFQFTIPMLQNGYGTMYIQTQIEGFVDSPASMYGTIANHYLYYNAVTGGTNELSIEAWKFRAMKG